MREITANGKNVLVDNDNFEELSKYNWYLNNWGYAFRNVYVGNNKCKKLYIHHAVIGKPSKGLEVDHINRNKLDNRRENLRIVTISENKKNVGARKNNKCGVSRICFGEHAKKWLVQDTTNGKKTRIGAFKTFEEAKKALKEFDSRR